MDSTTLRLLLIEDNPGDVDLIKDGLSGISGQRFDIQVAIRLSEGCAMLRDDPSIDCVLLDLNLPDTQGLDTLRLLIAAAPHIPVVILTAIDDASLAVEAIHQGAQDYLLKDNLDAVALARIIRYAIERCQLENQLRKQRDELKALAEERAHLLEEEQEARTRAEAASEIKTQFLAMLTDKLQLPLTSIKGFSDTLLQSGVAWSAEEKREFMKILSEESDEMTLLVEQLLDLSKLRAGEFRVKTEPTSLAEIIERTNPPLQRIATKHHLRIQLPDSLPPILADRRRINLVLISLVRHSTRYSPSMTPITLMAQAQAENFVQISVVDEGGKVQRGAHRFLYEPFEPSLKAQDRYSLEEGLGMALCKEIVEAHGGHIWVGEMPLPNTQICFTLPTV